MDVSWWDQLRGHLKHSEETSTPYQNWQFSISTLISKRACKLKLDNFDYDSCFEKSVPIDPWQFFERSSGRDLPSKSDNFVLFEHESPNEIYFISRQILLLSCEFIEILDFLLRRVFITHRPPFKRFFWFRPKAHAFSPAQEYYAIGRGGEGREERTREQEAATVCGKEDTHW